MIVSDSWYAQPKPQKEKLSSLQRIKLFNKKSFSEQKEQQKIE